MIRKLNSYILLICVVVFCTTPIIARSISSELIYKPFVKDSIESHFSELILTEEEQSWLKGHPVIKVGADPNWAPFEFRDKNGEYRGLTIEYLKLIEEKLDIRFDFGQNNSWTEIIEKAYTKEIDILSGITLTNERSKHLEFTDIYLSHPITIFADKSSITHIRDLNELTGLKVAVVDGYYISDLLRSEYPEIDIVYTKSPQEALKLLNKKKVLAYVEGMVAASYYINEKHYKNIHIVGETPYSYQLRIGIRNDWPIFKDILQKTLNTITENERNYIYYEWISIKPDKSFNLNLFLTIVIPCVILLLFFVLWVRQLRKEVNRRKQAQQDLNNAITELKNTQTHLVQSEKMSTVGELTAGIAHEIKNPLNFIMMGMDGIINGVDAYEKIISAYEKMHDQLSEQDIINIQNLKDDLEYNYYRYECESLSKSVQEGVENIHEITKSLNTFSYFAGKEMVLSDINECIKSTLVILRNQYKYNIEIITDFGDIQNIKCFPGKLNQVFVNLISNAIQAIEDKGTITIRTFIEDNSVKISIKDSGIGIPEDVKTNIFTPFYTTKPIGKGTGLGLSISKNIIDEHKGTIEVISEIGKGTEFIISLPIN